MRHPLTRRRQDVNKTSHSLTRRLNRGRDLLNQRQQDSTQSNLYVVLRDLPLTAERFRRRIASNKHLLERIARSVLHHRHDIGDVDLALRGHLLDLINARSAEHTSELQ